MRAGARAMRVAVFVIMFLAAFLVGPGLAGPAQAHDSLESTSPADGSTVAAVPPRVVLTFNAPAKAAGTQIHVTGPSGDVASGAPELVDNEVRQGLSPGVPAGRYTVAWRVTSADGHPVSGSFSFTAKAAGAGTPTTSTPSTPQADVADGGTTVWPWVAGGAVLAIVAGALLVSRRRD